MELAMWMKQMYSRTWLNSKGLSRCVRTIGSSRQRDPVISERKKSGSDPGQFHYALITDAQYHGPLS
jgi:hypothetical protein